MKYDYFCEKCNKEIEVEHKMDEKPEIKCECGEVMKKAVVKKPMFLLLGEGWSSDGYAKRIKDA